VALCYIDYAINLKTMLNLLIKLIKRMMARRKGTKKRSLHEVNEHFEFLFNAVSTASGA